MKYSPLVTCFDAFYAQNRLSVLSTSFFLLLGLSACGRGGGEGPKPVVKDTTAPVITLIGDSVLTQNVREVYSDLGATAEDNIDGSVSVTMTGTVNTDAVGSYILTYTAVDASGNQAISLTRTVNVVDTVAPIITLNGSGTIEHNFGDAYTDLGATAIDNFDEAVDVSVTGGVIIDVVNSYIVTYTATDASGNQATSVTRTVNVADLAAPIITLNGAGTIEHFLGKPYIDSGAIAVDVVDGDVAVTVGGEVNINLLGEYVLTYSALDHALNTSSITRTVSVIKPPDNIAPLVNIIFPPQNSLTQGDRVIVRGKASDEGGGVKSVSVNGVEATSKDNFASWSATVPLDIGENLLDVLVTDVAGNTNTIQVTSQIKYQPVFINQPYSMSFDSKNNRVLIIRWSISGLQQALVSVDLATGKSTIISDDNTLGVDASLRLGFRLALDSVNNRVLVTSSEKILAVDLKTGLRTVLSGNNLPNSNNPIEYSPADIVIDDVNNRAIIINGMRSTAKLIAIDLVSGNRTIISDNTTPNTNNPFSYFHGIELDTVNNRAFVITGRQILIVDLASGERTILTSLGSPNASNAISYVQSPSMALDRVNNRLIVADKYSGAIFSINLTTKVKTLLLDSSQADNASIFRKPVDISLDVTNNRLLIIDEKYNSIIAMNLATKALSPLFNGTTSTKNLIENKSPITFDVSNDRFILSNDQDVFTINAKTGEGSVFASNGYNVSNRISAMILDNSTNKIITATNNGIEKHILSTGERKLFSGRGVPNNVNNFYSLSDFVLDEENNRYLASDQSLGAIFSIDLVTGSRTLLSDRTTRNSNNPLFEPVNIELDKGNNRLLVLDRVLTAIIAVDLTNGARSIIWDNGFPNANTDLLSPRDFVYDKANNRVFVVDSSLDALVTIDLATGTSSIVSDNVTPDSVNVLNRPVSLALDSANNRVLVLDTSLKKLFAINLISGARSIVSDLSGHYGLKGLLLDKENDKAIVSNSGYLFEINLADGSYTISYIDNSKVMPYRANTIEIDTVDNRIVVLRNDSIYSVDLSDGSKTVISKSAEFKRPVYMSLDVEGRQAYVVDNMNNTVIKTDLTNGFTEVLSSPVIPDTVNAFTSPQSIAVDIVNQRALVTALNKVYAINLITGSRTILSSNTIPDANNAFQQAGSIVLDKKNNRALVFDGELAAIISVDLTTGVRDIISDSEMPNANTPIPDIVHNMTLDTTRNRLILTFVSFEGVMAIDLTDGQRVFIAK